MLYKNEFEKVFGNLGNGNKTVGYDDADRKKPREMRVGKTARDKANGHQAGVKNRRIWDDGGRAGAGKWVKV